MSANALTLVGFLLSIGVAGLLGSGQLVVGGLAYILVNCFDFLDGAVARESGTAGPFGAFFDSLLDRPSDAAPLIGLVYWYAGLVQPWLAVLCGTAIVTSFMVSYARARAEGLGLDCEVGWLQRPERTVLLGVGLVASGLHPLVLPASLVLLTVVSAITIIQRVSHVANLIARQR